ncbi:MAG: T9SS type A sorting domain-containing protein [Bacteroidetes bacterium]|nr:T9SS type A sorting domain-containing protein [Bacteroidota bacterium]
MEKISKLRTSALILISLLFIGWGSTGHKIVNQNAVLFFPPQMNEFLVWSSTLAQHASDADNRKNSDPTESPKHFIDIDYYPEFISTGRISQSYDSVVAAHGLTFVTNEGTLPWAIIAAYDTLKNCFARRDFNRAVLIAADLGHYVADSHQPLHITKNYNPGGLHSRYESNMIDTYQSQVHCSGGGVQYIPNVSNFVFNFIYFNYSYVDSLIIADNAAKAVNSDTKSVAYYQKLWDLTGNFTIALLDSASGRLASLIYTAWTNAGSPLPSTTEVTEIKNAINTFELYQNYPNPFNPSTTIKYTILSTNSPLHGGAGGRLVTLKVYDILGGEVTTLVNEVQSPGNYSVQFGNNLNKGLTSGVYFYKLSAGNYIQIKKMILLK